jgi:hypothetical protein
MLMVCCNRPPPVITDVDGDGIKGMTVLLLITAAMATMNCITD